MPKEMVVKRKRHKGRIDNDRSNGPIPQHSMEKANGTKIELLDEYYNYNSQRLVPVTIATLIRLAENAEKWAYTTEKGYKIQDFMILQGISEYRWARYCQMCPRLQEANDNMLTILGCRREAGLIERRFEPGSTIFMMPKYDKDWADMCKWRASLKPKEVEHKGGETFVVIEKYPESDLVPKKEQE